MSKSYTLPSVHDHDITDIKFHKSGAYLASCALDGTVVVYNLQSQRPTHHFEINEAPSCLSWLQAKNGYFSIAVGSAAGTLHQITFRQDCVSRVKIMI
jgi:WD40 repeat protein